VHAYRRLPALWQPTTQPDGRAELLRGLMRTRRKFVRLATRAYNSIGTRLSQWYCPLQGQSTRGKQIRAIVEDLHRGQFASDNPSFASAHLAPALIWEVLNRHYAHIDQVKAEVHWLEEKAKELADKALVSRLMTIPGVGLLTALTWCAELEPCSRFPSAHKAVAYAGFDPTPQISAGKVTSVKCRLRNSHIRSALTQAAQTCLNGKSGLAERVRRIISRKLPAEI